MVSKVLAWSALATAVLFAIATLVAVFARSALGPQGAAIAFWIGVGMLVISILLAVALLLTSTMSFDSRSDSPSDS